MTQVVRMDPPTQVAHTSAPTRSYLALAFEFPMRGSVHRPVLPVLPDGCVACRHGEWRNGKWGLFDTIIDLISDPADKTSCALRRYREGVRDVVDTEMAYENVRQVEWHEGEHHTRSRREDVMRKTHQMSMAVQKWRMGVACARRYCAMCFPVPT